MRLAAAISFLLALGVMALAAYLGAKTWETALYVDVIVWALALLLISSAVLETQLGARAAWGRSGLAALAALGSVAASLRVKPGSLEQFPLHDLGASGLSVGALGLALGALGLGAATLKLDKRGPNILAGLAMLAALVALRGWLQRGG